MHPHLPKDPNAEFEETWGEDPHVDFRPSIIAATESLRDQFPEDSEIAWVAPLLKIGGEEHQARIRDIDLVPGGDQGALNIHIYEPPEGTTEESGSEDDEKPDRRNQILITSGAIAVAAGLGIVFLSQVKRHKKKDTKK